MIIVAVKVLKDDPIQLHKFHYFPQASFASFRIPAILLDERTFSSRTRSNRTFHGRRFIREITRER